jgi:hypothetical protein
MIAPVAKPRTFCTNDPIQCNAGLHTNLERTEDQAAAKVRQPARFGSKDWLEALQGSFKRSLRSPHDSAILSLAGPALLALAADPLLSMVDTAFVGQLGAPELVSTWKQHEPAAL